MEKRISIICVRGCHAGMLMGAVDFFRAANVILKHVCDSGDEHFKVQIVSPDGKSVRCSNSYKISVNGNFDLIEAGDVVLCVPFSMDSKQQFLNALNQNKLITKWLTEHSKSFDLLIATSVAVFLLAEAKLLVGKKISTAWWFHELFQEMYHDVEVDNRSILIRDGKIVTAGAHEGWRDACMYVVKKHVGQTLAKTVSKFIMTDYEKRSLAPDLYVSQLRTQNAVVNAADVWIQNNLSKEITIHEISQQVSVSSRTLTRHFQSTLGESPQRYVQNARIQRSKLLLQITEFSISQITYRCGYSDVGAFRRVFKRHCSMSPTEYRRMVRQAVGKSNRRN